MPGLLTPPLEDLDHVRGPHGATHELVMFGDFECPYCRATQSVLRRVEDRLPGELRFAFRHLPIAERHPLAYAAAEASESAAAQGGFWEYHDALYAQPSLTREGLVKIAAQAGLDSERLAREVEEGRWRQRVERDVRSASASGARGTPTFFVNGVLHEEAFDAGSLVEALRG